jgi:hypothetical protein
MTFDKTQINTIDEAKNAEYGGKPLTDAEKKIFDGKNAEPLLDNTGSLNVVELQNTAELLNKIKQSQVKIAKDSETSA